MHQHRESDGRHWPAGASNAAAGRSNGYQNVALSQERERLATYGGMVLSDRELLALVVDAGGGTLSGCNAHILAGRLLARFGSVRAVGRAHPGELAALPGYGEAAAARLAAAFELGRRAGIAPPPVVIRSSEDVARVAEPLLAGQARERLVVVICDRVSRVLGCELLSVGSADRALLPVREALVAVLRRDGQNFALAHNHPSSDATPSQNDIEGTRRVREAASVAGLHLLWHVVVGDGAWAVVPAGGVKVSGPGDRF